MINKRIRCGIKHEIPVIQLLHVTVVHKTGLSLPYCWEEKKVYLEIFVKDLYVKLYVLDIEPTEMQLYIRTNFWVFVYLNCLIITDIYI